MEENQTKVYSFLELMDYFSVNPDLKERKKVYQMIKTWSGIQNIVMSWDIGKKYKIESNQTTTVKNNICSQNRQKTKNVLRISKRLYMESPFIQDFKEQFLKNFIKRDKIDEYISKYIEFLIKKGFYTPQMLFQYIYSIKSYHLDVNDIFIYIPFYDENYESMLLPNKNYTEFQSINNEFIINYAFSFSERLTNDEHICVSYSNQEYLPVDRVRIFKKNEVFTNQVLKRKMKFIDFSKKFHTYFIVSDEEANICYIIFGHGRIWDREFILSYMMGIINFPEYNNNENENSNYGNRLKKYFSGLMKKLDELTKKYKTIVLSGHSEGSSYAQAFGAYIAKRNKEYIPSTYIITSAGFSWIPSEQIELYHFMNETYNGRMMMFGFYQKYSYNNQVYMYVDPFIFENYYKSCIQPSKILFINNDEGGSIYRFIENSIEFEDILTKFIDGLNKQNNVDNIKRNIINNIKKRKKYQFVFLSPSVGGAFHQWKPSYIDSLMYMYSLMKVPSIAENNEYHS